ncbi:MAG: PilZ domain-containing protein [Acidobacteria bacterium]|nr:PilZ domain-containing protein [Acidobacteriota bacterium]MBV9146643.1 PilZ domain-containing protein [Acidobacteriota bacterium]MBV9435616.1 PilZ domain-containing protein [Acidobacteriota bacterium]
MDPQALIYTADVALSGTLSSTLRRQRLEPVCAGRLGAALHLLRSRKFPAVIVDCSDRSAATDIFQLCRSTGSNRSSVVFALTEGNESASSWGVNFAVKRPAGSDLRAFTTVLRAADGMIRQDFRRYRRIPVLSTAVLDNDEHRLQLSTLNISEGGMCVHGEVPGWNKEHIIEFHHPVSNLRFKANTYTVWSRNGKSGLQFRFMSNAAREALSSWIEAQ